MRIRAVRSRAVALAAAVGAITAPPGEAEIVRGPDGIYLLRAQSLHASRDGNAWRRIDRRLRPAVSGVVARPLRNAVVADGRGKLFVGTGCVRSGGTMWVEVSTCGALWRGVGGRREWSWTRVALDRFVHALLVHDGRLFVGTEVGLHVGAVDRPRSRWSVVRGVPRVEVRRLGRTGETLYAATVRGVYRSDDGGRSWSRRSTGLPALPPRTLEVNPPRFTGLAAAGSTVWVAYDASGLGTARRNGLYVSRNRGRTWALSRRCVYANGVRVAAGAVWLGCGNNGWMSRDEGRTWRSFLVGREVDDFAFRGRTVFAETDDGVYRTSDAGTTWRRVLRDPVR